MKIAAADLALQSEHSAQTRRQSEESLRAWRGERPDFEGRRGPPAVASIASAVASISAAAYQALAQTANAQPAPAETDASGTAKSLEAAEEAIENDPRLFLIKRMLEHLLGREMRIFDREELSAELRQVEVRTGSTSAQLQSAAAGNGNWGVEYDYREVREEVEATRFSAQGTIRTADGKEISFTLELEMTRYYREETNVSLRAGNAAVRKDPLVVNFDGTAAQLSGLADQRFRFDLDGNGTAEDLPLFASGSGYLAFDRNGNGKIDSGKELFGPGTGNGFGELARLDGDGNGNGWIDENDAAFQQLSVWTPAAAGDGSLRSLAELGIGALGLARVATPFALRGSDNADLGVVKESGVYLTESGQAGTLQEIDLTM